MLALFCGMSAAADSVLQIWSCELRDGKTADEVESASAAWLAAAKSMPGGAEFSVAHVVTEVGDTDPGEFFFVLTMPNHESWGRFMDAYPGSAAQAADEAWDEVAECEQNEIYLSFDIG